MRTNISPMEAEEFDPQLYEQNVANEGEEPKMTSQLTEDWEVSLRRLLELPEKGFVNKNKYIIHEIKKHLAEKIERAVEAETKRILALLNEEYGYESDKWLLINQRIGARVEQRQAIQEVENLITHRRKSAKLLTPTQKEKK
jgi:hypothetical protein